MKLGFVGLGKMGSGMVARLGERGHEVIAFDKVMLPEGGTLGDMIGRLEPVRTLWLMVPHKQVEEVLEELVPLLSPGDVILDGGNSFFKDSQRRASALRENGIAFFDVGVSGGPKGAREGACVMVGGQEELFQKYKAFLEDVAAPDALFYVGGAGAGHFAKMVHNAIEYGMMQAIAEGFSTLKASEFRIDLARLARLYNHGSVIESRLVGWLEKAFRKYGDDLEEVTGVVSQTGEGVWALGTARELGVDVPVIQSAVEFRSASEKNPTYSGKILSALRNQFGDHDVRSN